MSLDHNAIGIKGAEATIKWGYLEAAQLRDWSFTGSGSAGGAVSGTVVTRDAFALTQAPLTLVLLVTSAVPDRDSKPVVTGVKPVKWPVREVVDQGPTVMIIVGPCERASYG